MQVLLEARAEQSGGGSNLVNSRTADEALRFHEARSPQTSRMRLGRLSKARNRSLQIVDAGLCLEERTGQTGENARFEGAPLLLRQRRLLYRGTSLIRNSPPP